MPTDPHPAADPKPRTDPDGSARSLLGGAEQDGLLLIDPARRLARPSKLKVVAVMLLLSGVAAGVWVWSNRRSPRERAAQSRVAAAVAVGEGDLPGAEAHLRAAIEAAPSDATLHSMLGDVLAALRDEPGALAAYAEAVRIAPRHADARTARARRMLASGDAAGALAEIDAIGALPADAAPADLVAGDALVLMGEPGAALERFERALERPVVPDRAMRELQAAYIARFLGRTTGDAAMLAAAEKHGHAAAAAAVAAGKDALQAEASLLVGRTHTAIRLLDEGRVAVRYPALAAAIEFVDGQGALAEIRLRECIDGDVEPEIRASARAALVRLLACDGRAAAAAGEYRALAAAGPDTPERRDAGEQAARALLLVDAADDLLLRTFVLPPTPFDPLSGELAALVVQRGKSPVALRVRLALSGAAALRSGDAAALGRIGEDVEALLRAVPADPAGLVWSAALALHRGEARRALDILDPAVGPDSPPHLRVVRSLALAKLGRWAEVLDECRVLRKTGDDSPVSAALAMDSHLALGEVDAANAVAARSVLAWPGDPTIDSAWERVLTAVAPTDDGSEAARMRAILARQRDASGTDPLRRRAAIRELAIAALDDALARERLLGAFDDAAAAWAEMEREHPDDPRPPLARAAFFTRAGKLQQAERLLRAAAQRLPALEVQAEHGRSLARIGRHDEALAVLAACRGRAPVPEAVDVAIADVQRLSGDSAAAATTLRGVLASADAPPAVQAQAAVDLATTDAPGPQDRKAVAAWLASEAAAKSPADVRTLTAAALALAEGDLKRAATIADEVPHVSPRRADAVLVQATAWLAAGEPEKAEEILVACLATHPADRRLRSLASQARIADGLRLADAGEFGGAAARFEGAILGGDLDLVAAAVLADALQRSGDRFAAAPAVRRLESVRSASPGVPLLRGLLASAAGDAARAAREFAEAFRREPSESATLSLHAQSQLAAGNPRAAREACERAIEAGERSGLAEELLGSIHRQAGDLTGAEAKLRIAVARDPGNAGALASLVEVLVAQRNLTGARQVVASSSPAGDGEPADREVRFRRIRLFVVAGPVRGAIERCAAVFAGRPQAWRAYQDRARALLLTGDAAGAIPLLEKAVEIAPGEFMPQALLVRALADSGRVDEADDELAARAAANPQDPISRCLRGMIAERAGRTADGERHYRSALAADEDCALAANNLACMLVSQPGKHEEAKTLIARYALRFPGDPVLAASRAWVAIRAGTPGEAVEIAREGIARNPSHAGLHARLAEALLAIGNERDARESFKTAISLDRSIERTASDELRRVGPAK